jgi:hypothetical protein
MMPKDAKSPPAGLHCPGHSRPVALGIGLEGYNKDIDISIYIDI